MTEVHKGCGGNVVLSHDVWKCNACGLQPVPVDAVDAAKVPVEMLLDALDPSGAVMKYGALVARVVHHTGVRRDIVYGEVGPILQRLKHEGLVELVKGPGAGWRLSVATINERKAGGK